MINIAYPLAWYIVFIISVTVHEAAHAWAAKLGGDLTAYSGGQVSLNPFPHIKREPWGMVVFPLISAFVLGWPFGYASTPYDPLWADDHPRKAGWMAAAGPAANLLLIVLCYIAVQAGILTGVFMEPDSVGFRHIVDPNFPGGWAGFSIFFSILFTMNLILLILNLIPLPPLDGSGIIALFLHDNAARRYRTVIANPIFGFVGLLIAWQVLNPLFHTAFPGVMNIFYWGAGFHY